MASYETQIRPHNELPQTRGLLRLLFGPKDETPQRAGQSNRYEVIRRFDLKGANLAPCPVEIQRLPVGAHIDAIDLFTVPSHRMRIIADVYKDRRGESWRYLVLRGPQAGSNGDCLVVEEEPGNRWTFSTMRIREAFVDYLGDNTISQEAGLVVRVPKGGCELVEVGMPGEQDNLIPSESPVSIQQLQQPDTRDVNRYWGLLRKLSESPKSPASVQAHLRVA